MTTGIEKNALKTDRSCKESKHLWQNERPRCWHRSTMKAALCGHMESLN